MAPTTVEPTTLGELRPLLELVPSPLNPRKHFDKTKLEELAASIASKGIIEPLIVRERPGFGQLEIVAGERRYRAAKMAKHDVVPVIIRRLSDVEVLELMAIENSQRDDLHPLEEADGFKALMKADASYTPKAIAAKIGKSERYVHQRLQLARLEPAVKKAFLDGHIQAGHADLISRLKADDQAAALKACFHHLFGEDKERGCISVRQLDTWIEANVRLTLTKDDPQNEFFPELADTVADAAKILQVAGSYIPPAVMAKEMPGVLSSDAYRRVQGKSDRCGHAEKAAVVIGTGKGKFIEICRARTACKKHYKWEIEQTERDAKVKKRLASRPSASTKPPKATAAEKRAREKADATRTRALVRENALHELRRRAHKKLGAVKPSPALLRLIGWNSGSEKRYPDWKSFAAELLSELGANTYNDKEWTLVASLVKPFGFDLLAIERRIAEENLPKKASQTSAKKKAAKK